MNICLTFDDFSPINNNIFFLKQLKRNYPGLKVTVFTIPETIQTGKIESWKDHMDLVEELKELDWLEYCPHGWNHPNQAQFDESMSFEFGNITFYETEKYIKMVDVFFKEIGLPYQKIFKAPQFNCSKAAKDCFRNYGWTLAIDKEAKEKPSDIKTIEWNWNIKNHLPDLPNIVGYAHIQSTGNGLLEWYEHLLEMPSDAKFMFLSEIKELL